MVWHARDKQGRRTHSKDTMFHRIACIPVTDSTILYGISSTEQQNTYVSTTPFASNTISSTISPYSQPYPPHHLSPIEPLHALWYSMSSGSMGVVAPLPLLAAISDPLPTPATIYLPLTFATGSTSNGVHSRR